MKMFFVMLVLSINAFAAPCAVDGISDSPQAYHCNIKNGVMTEKLELVCRDGNYGLIYSGKEAKVTAAYHEEVEEGSNPLVFVADRITLTTISQSSFAQAFVVVDGKNLEGRCTK